MPTHVALLRGINLGSHKRVAMAALREVVASLGHADVATYIQSGNVVFTAADGLPVGAAELEKTIATELGVSCRVVVRTCAELAQAVADNPYPDEPNPKLVHAIFLTDDPSAEAETHVAAAQQRAAARGSGDETRLVGRTFYLHTPDGFGRSKLAEELSRPRGPAEGTARNWATVLALLAMCEGP